MDLLPAVDSDTLDFINPGVRARLGAISGALTPMGEDITTPDGATVGALVGYYATADCTVDGVTLTAGQSIVLVWDGAAWVVPSSPGGTPTDTTPPTAGTLAASASDASTISLSVSGALDADGALAASPYSFRWSSNGGTSWSAWTAYQSSASYTVTGLTSSTTYTLQHRVRNTAGLITEGATVTRATTATLAWVTRSFLPCTAADGTNITALTPTEGDLSMVTNVDLRTGNTVATPKGLVVSNNKARTPSEAVYTTTMQAWNLRSAPQTQGHRVTLDYDMTSTEIGGTHLPRLLVAFIYSPSAYGVGVSLERQVAGTVTLSKYGEAGGGVGTYSDATTSATSTTGMPLTGTLVVEVIGSVITVSIGGTVRGTITMGGPMLGTGAEIRTTYSWINIDNIRFEARQLA